MGISELKRFLQEIVPSSFKKYPLRRFGKNSIAVDISCFVYKTMYWCQLLEIERTNFVVSNLDTAAVEKKLLSELINHISVLLENEITPILIFDGRAIDDKHQEIKRRGDLRKKKKTQIDEELSKLRSNVDTSSVVSIAAALSATDNKVSTLMKQHVEIPATLRSRIREMFSDAGFPVIQAKHDAEKVCASLSIEKQVAAVYSIDSDCLPLGIEYFIYEIKKEPFEGIYCDVCSYIHLPTVLWHLGMTHQQFIDFCILCGCDYNKRIPNIGPKRAYKHMMECGCIENCLQRLNPTQVDVNALNYVRCRELYVYEHVEDLVDGRISLTFDLTKLNNLSNVFVTYGQENHINKVVSLVKSIMFQIAPVINIQALDISCKRSPRRFVKANTSAQEAPPHEASSREAVSSDVA